MGLADRDYSRGGARGLSFSARSMVTILITVNVVIWIIEVLFVHTPDNQVLRYLSANPVDIFERHYYWQIFTANFLHTPDNPWHLFGNMLFLYFFGRELEEMYGRRDFLIFYLTAGVLAILAEAAISYYGDTPARILGASGAVMGVVVLFTLFFPQRPLSLFLLPITIPAWILCLLYVFFDISGALGGSSRVAHWAHLTGAAWGLLYWALDLRSERLLALVRGLGRRRPGRRGPRLVRDREPVRERSPRRVEPPARDPVSARIDEILEKIARSGQESLSSEEMDYLKKNSGRYRSEG